MRLRKFCLLATCLASLLLAPHPVPAQQVVQRGAFGKPDQVLDDTNQWTTPLLVASDHDVQIYIPDVTSPEWLKLNYPNFRDRRIYTLSIFTLYKTTEACRANQIGWGLGDAAHLNACVDIGYRVRQVTVDPNQKSVTLLMAAMVGQDGQIDPESIQRQSVFRTWDQLDVNSYTAIMKANALATEQLRRYDIKMQNLR